MRISKTDPGLRSTCLARLVERLPPSAQPVARWLQQPAARPVRIPVGALLCIGGVFGVLPVLGFWMLPAGLVLLAEDVPPLSRATGRMLDWVERRRPYWFAPAPDSSATAASIVDRPNGQGRTRRSPARPRGVRD